MNFSLEGDLCEAQDSEREIKKSESIDTTYMSKDEMSEVQKTCSFFSKLWNLWCINLRQMFIPCFDSPLSSKVGLLILRSV